MTEVVMQGREGNVSKPGEFDRRELGRLGWNNVVSAKPPVEYHIGGQTVVDFAALAHIGRYLDLLQENGGAPIREDARYASVPRSMVNLVRLEDSNGKSMRLKHCDLPEITDENRGAVAAGLWALRQHFPDAFRVLKNRICVGITVDSILHDFEPDTAAILPEELRTRLNDFALLMSDGDARTIMQKQMVMKDAELAGEEILQKSPADRQADLQYQG